MLKNIIENLIEEQLSRFMESLKVLNQLNENNVIYKKNIDKIQI